ncbi:hypothetical protein [Paraburkholderia sp. JHI869]
MSIVNDSARHRAPASARSPTKVSENLAKLLGEVKEKHAELRTLRSSLG